MTPACKDCRWWVRGKRLPSGRWTDDPTQYKTGDCRARSDTFAKRWDDDWCGEFDERPEPRMDATPPRGFDVT